ncbi:hypothetical protein Pmar_PMAR009755 [Perkinsus marinus ATCC 50983]|uniref:Lon proteolytic domain-containing protein n=1 Tax=Perkinsus marinus (strain ATCC 50983 / TXsc) TaxID=423536 RepID=C5KZG1_PERM5|nr:hypothetical protein Pmar_PMAR009755 [Perkinsus marinus ATCC 50983]EER10121.1 hypothetical protein Pmar_PMAR009755 [Perkinsus marinus ATCC 50983]|eukprot:XP_002778326.1 hypothetical protein Pmar_PMAR009755 [Perkinsus marinus ATCC 50983]
MIPKIRVELNEDGIFTVRKDTFDDPVTVREAREELLRECEKLAARDSKFALKWVQALARCEAKDLHWMPDALAEILTISDEEKVSLLEERSLVARARRVGDIIRGKVGDGQKDREDIDQLIDLGRKIPLGNTGDRTRRVFEKELTRLSQLEPSSQEYAVTRQYLDVVLSLPWTSTEGVVDFSAVRSSLSATHYGLEEVKERVVELWALGKMSHPSTGQGTEELPMRVTEESLVDWLGLPTYPGNRWTRGISPSSASVVGLGWTEAGGTMLEVECLPSSEWLITGQVGVTLQETVRIAASWSKITNPMHVNIGPDVSARKDGPSLGLALAALFWAQRRERTVPHGIGFTGAITLSGGVERVGGIREKVVAASLGGLKVVVLPKANKAEWKAIEDGLKDGLEVVFVEDLTELEGLLDELAELRRESFMYEV